MGRPEVGFNREVITEELDATGLLVRLPGLLAPADTHEGDGPSGSEIDLGLGNKSLPVFDYKQEIQETIRDNPVTIIVAETGAGKSTQVPQFLLEKGYNKIYVTQPRRAAAYNVAMRIREEIADVKGEFAAHDLVRYQTAGSHEGPRNAAIQVVTDGLHLVCELHDKGIADNDVLIIDEAHEWNSNVEVLIAWTKKALAVNPRLRVVVMSATMDAEHLADYYKDICILPPPIIEIPGKTFNVESAEKPDSTVIDEVLKITRSMLTEDGEIPDGANGILVFEPGKREIQDLIDSVSRRLPKEIQEKTKVFPLHANLPPAEQQAALQEYPGFIKIVVATDIAQTSLTIPDIKYVVDSGWKRHIEIDQEGVPGLKMIPISQADCKQRAGRTGRVADGYYILTKLNATTPHVLREDRELYPSPEITRTDVARNTLRLKDIGLDIAAFDMYHRASSYIIDLAKRNLKLLGALDEAGDITRMGQDMNRYPVCTSSARILVEAARYQDDTRNYLAAITAVKEAGGMQYYGQNVGKRWQELTDEQTSDLLVQLDLFIQAQSMTVADFKLYDLDYDNFRKASEQYVKIAKLAGATHGTLLPPNEQQREDIKSCLYPGFITSIYKHDSGKDYVHVSSLWDTKREMSNRSQVTGTPSFIMGDPYRIEPPNGETRHCVEGVTQITAQQLGRVAAKHAVWSSDGFTVRDGKFKEVKRQILFGVLDLGIVEEVPAAPSAALRAEVIAYALEHPGDAQKELRRIKADLEKLARIAKDPVPQLTHARLIELVHAAAPGDIATAAEIEEKLRIMIADPTRRLRLDDFVDAEQREYIRENAPSTLEFEGARLQLRYRSGQPIVSRYNPADVINLKEEVFLKDGRHILWSRPSDGKKYTLLELKAKLKSEAS